MIPITAIPIPWNFWLPDNDRSSGWTNHCYVLQLVCHGYGATPAEAWEDARSRGEVPDDFRLPDTVVATRWDAERENRGLVSAE